MSIERGSRKARRRIATGAVLALAAASVTTAALLPGDNSRSSARAAIAIHPYKDPSITRVANVGIVTPTEDIRPDHGPRDRILVTLSLPTNPATEKLKIKYASNNETKSVVWEPYSLVNASILGNATLEKYDFDYIPSSDTQNTELGLAFLPDRGMATIEMEPLIADPDGTKVALYAKGHAFDTEEVQQKTSNGQQEVAENKDTYGYQYIGTITRQAGQWEIDTTQQALPDLSSPTPGFQS